jgi:hypothetical protein
VEHLDPLLESADELAGKLHALARMISNRYAANLRMLHRLTAMS